MRSVNSNTQLLENENSRRQFLQRSAQAATVLCGGTILAGCGGGGASGDAAANNTSHSENAPVSNLIDAPKNSVTGSPSTLAKIPSIWSFSPVLASRGAPVLINGSEMNSVTSVKFGEVETKEFRVLSSAQLEVIVPASATTGKITLVTAGGGAASSDAIDVALLPKSAKDYRLVWRDEFEGNALDRTKWTPLTRTRGHAVQTVEAVTVEGSIMKISTYTDPSTGTHHTGFLRSAGHYALRFGYVEARIRFKTKPGQWGAFWLLSYQNLTSTPPNPAAGAEVDIIEHRAIGDKNRDVSKMFQSAVHWNGYGEGKTLSAESGERWLPVKQSFEEWHTVGVLWTPQGYEFYLDGAPEPHWKTDKGLSLSDEFIKLTCEIKDGGWAGNIPKGGYGPLGASTNGIMEVDWVRAWQK